jgi:hypothetical protein
VRPIVAQTKLRSAPRPLKAGQMRGQATDVAAALADRLIVQVTEAERRVDQARAEVRDARQEVEQLRQADMQPGEGRGPGRGSGRRGGGE